MRKEKMGCDVKVIHEEVVSRVRQLMPQHERFFDLAQLFKVLGDATRVKIIWALFQGEMCVCDIASLLKMSQSAISHQLRVLKQARLIKGRRAGKVVYYALKDRHIENIFAQGWEHIHE